MTKVTAWLPLVLLFLAACDEAAGPDALIYDGKIVHPSCFSAVDPMAGDSRSLPVDLKSCMADAPPAPEPDEYGFYTQEQNSGDSYSGYIGYKYIGRIDAGEVVHLISSGGGSGQFSELVALAREGDTLRLVRSYGGGDRCGGIADAKIENGKVFYTQGATPADLATLNARSADEAYDAGGDLDACAVCCIAAIRYSDGAPISVSFADDWESGGTDGRMACFEKELKARLGARQKELSYAQAQDFAASLGASCPLPAAP